MRFLMLPCDALPTLSLRGLFSGGLRGAGTFPLPVKPLPTPNFLLLASRFMLPNLARAYRSSHAMHTCIMHVGSQLSLAKPQSGLT